MKKVLSVLLVVAMVACMLPMFSITSSAAAPKITVDGNLADWEGVKSISITGSGDFQGKKATWYAVVTSDGLYLACDAYHGVYKTDKGAWHENSNFEIFVGRENWQYYVSAKGMSAEQTDPTMSGNNGNDGHKISAAKMVTTDIDSGAAKHHTVTEVFIAKNDLPDSSKGNTVRVGVAWKTPDDDCNNCGNKETDNWWTPQGTKTNEAPVECNQAVVTADGIVLIGDYTDVVNFIDIKSKWKFKTATSDSTPADPAGWPGSIDSSMQDGDAPFGNRMQGVSKNTWGTNDGNNGDGTQEKAYLWVAKEFTVDNVNELKDFGLYASMYYDDDIKLYINGTQVFSNTGWDGAYDKHKLVSDASTLLKNGKNVIAASLHQHTGGYEFDLKLYAEKDTDDNSKYAPMYASVKNANELLAYVAEANEATKQNEHATRNATLVIAQDIDMAGKTWVPLSFLDGIIEGNNKTISNITYVTDATTGNFGLIANKLANSAYDGSDARGVVKNLTIKDSIIVATATDGRVGGVAGFTDRGRIIGVTLDNVTVIGNKVAGGVAGRAEWESDGDHIKIENCAVKNSTVIAVDAAGTAAGIVASFGNGTEADRGGLKVKLGDYTLDNVTVQAKTNGKVYAAIDKDTCTTEGTATKEDVTLSETVTSSALADNQAAKAWDSTSPAEVKISVNAVAPVISALKVDGKAVKASNYTVAATDAGFDVTLKDAYLKTLKTGTYKIVIETYLGNTAEVTLTVTNEQQVEPPVETGDTALAIAFVSTLSLLALAATVVAKKRSALR